jgi:hypothetical protein
VGIGERGVAITMQPSIRAVVRHNDPAQIVRFVLDSNVEAPARREFEDHAHDDALRNWPSTRATAAASGIQLLDGAVISDDADLRSAAKTVYDIETNQTPECCAPGSQPGVFFGARAHSGGVALGLRGVRLCARFLPDTIVADCHANPTIADLCENRAFTGLTQAPACGWREVVHLTPKRKWHNPVIRKRTGTRALPM